MDLPAHRVRATARPEACRIVGATETGSGTTECPHRLPTSDRAAPTQNGM